MRNFSQRYMSYHFPGNTDLLEKRQNLQKRIAALESERKSFNKGRGESSSSRPSNPDIAN